MSGTLPLVTIVIPARAGQADVAAVAASVQLGYPKNLVEILLARGSQPSVQRNKAVSEARGQLIYFLDDDSLPEPDNLRLIAAHFRRPDVLMVGGPALCPPHAPMIERVFALVMGSWLAFGPSRARYKAVGHVRKTNEKELILCNLAARRSALLETGGFDEALYPNEENVLMDELQSRGGTLLYDPELVVHRRPRNNLRAFTQMLATYGRGRAEQLRLHPTPGSALNFLPPLFCLYLLATPLLPGWCRWPWLAYGLALIGQTIALQDAPFVSRMLALPLIFLSHLLYGAGFWRGLFTKVRNAGGSPTVEVSIERINSNEPDKS